MYLETTVIEHLAARARSNIVVVARQLSSQSWSSIRDDYEVFVSQVVIDECSAGDPNAASERHNLIQGIAVLDIKPEAEGLAMALTDLHDIPKSEPRDALHIVIAAVGGLQFLSTWNLRHIANPNTRGLIARIFQDAGYIPPIICSPDELMET